MQATSLRMWHLGRTWTAYFSGVTAGLETPRLEVRRFFQHRYSLLPGLYWVPCRGERGDSFVSCS